MQSCMLTGCNFFNFVPASISQFCTNPAEICRKCVQCIVISIWKLIINLTAFLSDMPGVFGAWSPRKRLTFEFQSGWNCKPHGFFSSLRTHMYFIMKNWKCSPLHTAANRVFLGDFWAQLAYGYYNIMHILIKAKQVNSLQLSFS